MKNTISKCFALIKRITVTYIFARTGMILSGVLLLFLFVGGMILLAILKPHTYTEITDIAEYGKFTGTANNSFAQKYIQSFFPEEIRDDFKNVRYSYKAEDIDNYAFEAYLEFQIEDSSQFCAYVSNIAPESVWKEFSYNSSFKEYSIENRLWIYQDPREDQHGGSHSIQEARMRKILYSEETQTVIFVALGVYDGGAANTGFFNTYFKRFAIDPIEYAETAETFYDLDPFDISP